MTTKQITLPGDDQTHLSNVAPEDADPFVEKLEADHQQLADDAADLELEALSLPEKVESDEDAAKVTEFVAKAKTLSRKAEKARVEEKEPWLARSGKVDAFFKRLVTPVGARISRLEQDLNAHAKAKAERQRAERLAREKAEREEADRQRREAEAARQAAEAAQRQADEAAARIRSAADAEARAENEAQMRAAEQVAAEQRRIAEAAQKGAATSERVADTHGKAATGAVGKLAKTTAAGGQTTVSTFWTHEVTDMEAVIDSLGPLGPYLPTDVVTSAIARAKREAVAANRIEDLTIPGVRFFEDQKTNVLVSKPK